MGVQSDAGTTGFGLVGGAMEGRATRWGYSYAQRTPGAGLTRWKSMGFELSRVTKNLLLYSRY